MITDEFSGQLAFAVMWGLILIASFIGYGWLIGRILSLPVSKAPLAEMGLYGGWGLSFWIIFGGVLVFFGWVSTLVILSLTTGGLILCSYALVKYPFEGGINNLKFPSSSIWLGFISAGLMWYVWRGTNFNYNPNDDLVVYNALPQELLQTGTISDSFSWRRLTAYGAQSLLQASFMCVLPPQYMNLFDHGVCFLMSFILIANMIWWNGLEKSRLAGLLLVIVLIYPCPTVNVSTQDSQLLFSLLLVATYERLCGIDSLLSRSIMVALVGASYFALKMQFMIIVGLYLGFKYGSQFLSKGFRSGLIKEAGLVAMVIVVFLIPWGWVAFRSMGTFLYPLIPGNQPLDFAPGFLHESPLKELKWVVWYFWTTAPLMVLCVLYPAVECLRGKECMIQFYRASLVFSVLVAYRMSASCDQDIAVYRYVYGAVFGSIILGSVALISTLESRRKKMDEKTEGNSFFDISFLAQLVVVCVLASLILFDLRRTILYSTQIPLSGLLNYYPRPWTEELAVYRELQNKVPEGKPILVFANHQFLFDFHRNPILLGDVPGSCSPPPHMPMFRGPGPLAGYLKAQGIEYVIHSDFNAPGQVRSGIYVLYSKPFWHDMEHSEYEVWRSHAPYFLDLMDNVEKMESDSSSSKSGDLTLFHLQ